MNLNQQLDQVMNALRRKDGQTVANILRIRSFQGRVPLRYLQQMPLDRIKGICLQKTGASSMFNEFITFTTIASYYHEIHNFYEAANSQREGMTALFERLEDEPKWVIPIVHSACSDLVYLWKKARLVKAQEGQLNEEQRNTNLTDTLRAALKLCQGDRQDPIDSKKVGGLHPANCLLPVYLKIHLLKLCTPLLRTIKTTDVDYPIHHLVTYNYYCGRIRLFEDKYTEAEEMLTFAFEHCHPSYVKNKRLILQYLIPVKLLQARPPRKELFRKYHMPQFESLCSAVTSGNPLLLSQSLARYQEFFIQKGLYLILEKLKFLTFRNLFKKVFLIQNNGQNPPISRIDLLSFQTCLRYVQVDMDMDEIECILANLIYKKYIKGYISLKRATLVMAKTNAFPRLPFPTT